jgi:hypothetical protein
MASLASRFNGEGGGAADPAANVAAAHGCVQGIMSKFTGQQQEGGQDGPQSILATLGYYYGLVTNAVSGNKQDGQQGGLNGGNAGVQGGARQQRQQQQQKGNVAMQMQPDGPQSAEGQLPGQDPAQAEEKPTPAWRVWLQRLGAFVTGPGLMGLGIFSTVWGDGDFTVDVAKAKASTIVATVLSGKANPLTDFKFLPAACNVTGIEWEGKDEMDGTCSHILRSDHIMVHIATYHFDLILGTHDFFL